MKRPCQFTPQKVNPYKPNEDAAYIFEKVMKRRYYGVKAIEELSAVLINIVAKEEFRVQRMDQKNNAKAATRRVEHEIFNDWLYGLPVNERNAFLRSERVRHEEKA